MPILGKTDTRAAAVAAKTKLAASKTAAPKAPSKFVSKSPAPKKTTPKVTTTPVPSANIFENPTVSLDNTLMPNEATTQPTETPWSLETDPLYRSAMASGKSAFNYARNAALAEKQASTTALGQQRKEIDTNAAESRRRLAGNYAARNMAGGAAGALTQAEARANAEQIAARTSIADQIAALNNQFLQNFGDVTNASYDWSGTLTGQQYKTQAAQQAIEAALGRYGTV